MITISTDTATDLKLKHIMSKNQYLKTLQNRGKYTQIFKYQKYKKQLTLYLNFIRMPQHKFSNK